MTTTNAYICQCTFPNSGSNCELTISTPATRPACACILCPCPTTSAAVTNPCSWRIECVCVQFTRLLLSLGFPNPCQNNGGCTVNQNNAQCYCQPANTGYYCQYSKLPRIHELLYPLVYLARKRTLSNTLCANITCKNGGECHVNDQGPQCSCPKPYFGDRCEISESIRSWSFRSAIGRF